MPKPNCEIYSILNNTLANVYLVHHLSDILYWDLYISVYVYVFLQYMIRAFWLNIIKEREINNPRLINILTYATYIEWASKSLNLDILLAWLFLQVLRLRLIFQIILLSIPVLTPFNKNIGKDFILFTGKPVLFFTPLCNVTLIIQITKYYNK